MARKQPIKILKANEKHLSPPEIKTYYIASIVLSTQGQKRERQKTHTHTYHIYLIYDKGLYIQFMIMVNFKIIEENVDQSINFEAIGYIFN